VFDGWTKLLAKGFVLRAHGAIQTLVCRVRLENQFLFGVIRINRIIVTYKHVHTHGDVLVPCHRQNPHSQRTHLLEHGVLKTLTPIVETTDKF
jgi:KaiC/GvpD/RAD55 family RecA-like ATPase